MKILVFVVLVIIIAGVIYYFTQLSDKDGDGDIDLKDAKLTADEIKDEILRFRYQNRK